MAKFCLKKPSKRMEARRRYKIEKKVREHNRKKRKEAKLSSKRKPKLIHVPNECPFKEEIIQEAKMLKQQKEEERKKHREEMKEKKKEMKKNGTDEKQSESKATNEVAVLPRASESKDARGIIQCSVTPVMKKPSPLDCKRVLDSADVVLQVLDARDPIGTRCQQVEEIALKENKSLILILNKADLVPRDNLEKWLKYLRQSFPTIAFRSLTFKEQQKVARSKKKSKVANKDKEDKVTGVAVGKDVLLNMLSNYCKNREVKKSITVSVVGLPNVGKSSVVNSFKNSKICDTGNAPGVTKVIQLVQVNPKIKLLDSPGIQFDDLKQENYSSQTILKNVVKTELIKDFFNPVTEILRLVGNDRLTEIYDVFDFETNEEFFEKLARRCGRFKKGGDPDIANAARIVLNDWNSGKIRHHSLVPVKKTNLPKQNFNERAKDFEMDELLSEEKDVLDCITAMNTDVNVESVACKSQGPVDASILSEKKIAKKKTVQKKRKIKVQEKTKRKETEEPSKPDTKRMKKAQAKVLTKTQNCEEETDDYCFETDFVL